MKGALAGGDRALLEIVMTTHTGTTTVEFEQRKDQGEWGDEHHAKTTKREETGGAVAAFVG